MGVISMSAPPPAGKAGHDLRALVGWAYGHVCGPLLPKLETTAEMSLMFTAPSPFTSTYRPWLSRPSSSDAPKEATVAEMSLMFTTSSSFTDPARSSALGSATVPPFATTPVLSLGRWPGAETMRRQVSVSEASDEKPIAPALFVNRTVELAPPPQSTLERTAL